MRLVQVRNQLECGIGNAMKGKDGAYKYIGCGEVESKYSTHSKKEIVTFNDHGDYSIVTVREEE